MYLGHVCRGIAVARGGRLGLRAVLEQISSVTCLIISLISIESRPFVSFMRFSALPRRSSPGCQAKARCACGKQFFCLRERLDAAVDLDADIAAEDLAGKADILNAGAVAAEHILDLHIVHAVLRSICRTARFSSGV